jgi:hypothetical protein
MPSRAIPEYAASSVVALRIPEATRRILEHEVLHQGEDATLSQYMRDVLDAHLAAKGYTVERRHGTEPH